MNRPLGEWLALAVLKLRDAGIECAKLDAEVLAASVLRQSRSWVLAHTDHLVDPAVLDPVLARRAAREPLAYLTGKKEFYGRDFAVEPGVLVPRQETETLVESALDGLGGKVLDLCTGTGCVAVTIKMERPNWLVAASDIDPVAVRVARGNAESNGVVVHVQRSDLFEKYDGLKFAVVTCNPPYVARGEPLQPELAYEPEVALFADDGGMAIYSRLAQEAKPFLMPWGRIIVECGDGMEADVRDLFICNGWIHVETRPDLGGMPRAATFSLP